MDELKKLGFNKYVDSLSFAELKRFIANINKYVRQELIIRTTKKTHDALKKEVKSVWQVLIFDGVPGLETKSLKEIDDVVPRPTARQIAKVEREKEKQIIRQAKATLARVKKAMSKK